MRLLGRLREPYRRAGDVTDQPQDAAEMGQGDGERIARKQPAQRDPRVGGSGLEPRDGRLEELARLADPALEEPLRARAAEDLGVELGRAHGLEPTSRVVGPPEVAVDEVVRPDRGRERHDVRARRHLLAELEAPAEVGGGGRRAVSPHVDVTRSPHDVHVELHHVASGPGCLPHHQLVRAVEMPDRLRVGGGGLRAGAGDEVPHDGVVGCPGGVEVLGDEPRIHVRPRREHLGRAAMGTEPALLLLRLVRRIADQRVHELVGDRRGRVRQRREDPRVGEVGESAVEPALIEPADVAQQLDVDLAAEHRCGLGEILVVVERVQARREQITDGPGNHVSRAVPAGEGFRQFLREQRVAVAAGCDRLPPRLRDPVLVGELLDQLQVIGIGEPAQVDNCVSSTPPAVEFRPGGAEHEERSRGRRGGDPGEQLERRLIGPLEVLDQEQRPLRTCVREQYLRQRVERQLAHEVRVAPRQRVAPVVMDCEHVREVRDDGVDVEIEVEACALDLVDPGGVVIIGGETEAPLQHRGNRKQPAGSPIGRAVCGEHDRRRDRRLVHHLLGQTRLAHPGFAADEHGACGRGVGPVGIVPPPAEPLELGLTTDQAGAHGAGRFQAMHRVGRPQHAEHLDGTIDALQLGGTEGLDVEVAPYDLVGVVADDERARRRERLEARRLVRGRADHRVVGGRVGRPQLGDEDDTGVDAHPRRELDSLVGAEAAGRIGDPGEELEPGGHRSAGVVLARLREPEVHHDPVPLVAGDVPVLGGHRRAAQLVVAAQHVADDLGFVALGHLGGPHQVHEHHGELATFAFDAVGRRRRRRSFVAVVPATTEPRPPTGRAQPSGR